MINSLLELIGALFLAGLPIFLMLARIRRRRRLRREARDGQPQPRPRRESWLRSLLRRRPDADLAPYPEEAGGGTTTPRGGESRSRDTWNGLESESSSGYRSLSLAPGAEALQKRVDRYPPLQRAIVLKEILGPPKALDTHLPGGNT